MRLTIGDEILSEGFRRKSSLQKTLKSSGEIDNRGGNFVFGSNCGNVQNCLFDRIQKVILRNKSPSNLLLQFDLLSLDFLENIVTAISIDNNKINI